MLVILAIAAVSNLLANPAFALVPLLVSAHFGGGALELGWLQSAFGIGVIVGGLLLGVWGGFRRRILTVALASVLGGLAFVLLGALPPGAVLVAVGAAFVVGFSNPIVNGSLLAMFQSIIPPEMQGRIFTLILSITGVTTPIGLAIAGPVGDAFGVPVWFVVSGTVTSLMALAQLLVPSVKRIEEHRVGALANADPAPTP
jgi:DHA3 family macrolide efflux protein-like MFS transporter